MTSTEIAPNNGAGPAPAAKPAPPESTPGVVTEKSAATPPFPKITTAASAAPLTATAIAKEDDDGVNPVEFEGSVDSNHDLPTPETIRKIDSYVVLDRDGKSHTFRSLYTGKHTARRVLIIFVRHFYCGNCQNYLRTLSSHITPSSLLALPLSTFICVIGCGDPALIDMYAAATDCPFPIYADPTRRLYAELGMVRTLALGARPAYMKQNLLASSVQSIVQGLKNVPKGLALKGGDSRQVGGEFLFEPVALEVAGGGAVVSPLSPVTGGRPMIWGEGSKGSAGDDGDGDEGDRRRVSEASLDGKGEEGAEGEDKIVTWCHRMRNTRDHAEIPVLMEVLGLEGAGIPVEDDKGR
ncbi:hypothetical protein N657DRAFT_648214 [Parathielavia appendiculata]|uniref:Thioredoxin-like protein AAED1 n=1 Tax=Parathielavia appendiculata TaxID=2587402 RepID=A0AAN6TWB4_9PEZI|nr:hypothetical protein N657DRAFT_648214 [Parathielavia appendiculata]